MAESPFSEIINLYRKMDHAWDSIAQTYSFACTGCEDNCCQSLFYHHTHIERAFLLNGFHRLDPEKQKQIRRNAKAYCDQTFAGGNTTQSFRLICPVNEAGRCLLYPYRPMICRLHGLPHEVCRPGSEPVKGPGCDAGRFDEKKYTPFDRTSFYREMAQIEMAFRQQNRLNQKVKLTVAQIILSE